MLVSFTDFEKRYPRPLVGAEESRAEQLLEDAEEMIEVEFARVGRDFRGELTVLPWVASTAKRVIREMVSAAMLVGEDAGRRSSSVAAGQVSESYSFADVDSVAWGGVKLTPAQRADLGLPGSGIPEGEFPCPPRWPERWPQ